MDALGAAVQTWAAQRRKQLKQQVSFSKRLLKGRTGSERLAQASIEATSSLVVDQINEFLTGD